METIQLDLTVSDDRTCALLAAFDQTKAQAENLHRVKQDVLSNLTELLSGAIADQSALIPVFQDIQKTGNRFYHLNFCHPNPEVLNMPWEAAQVPLLDCPILDVPQLFLSRAASDMPEPEHRASAGPLKILIMIALPTDLPNNARLQVEQEERDIVFSFEQLFRSGEVSIDFTFNGSLNELKEKIDRNNYHILHFTGHGVFDPDKQEGRLLLEDPLTLKSSPVSGADFAEALIKDGHTLSLVMLSACQTGASAQTGLQGVCQAVLQKGIPSAAAMAMSVKDRYASRFAAAFYHSLAEKKPVVRAFKDAKQIIRALEYQDNAAQHIGNAAVFQWMIPVLYSKDAPDPVSWSLPFEPIKPEPSSPVFEGTTLRKSETDDVFVGRRADFSRVMPLLMDRKPVLLTGQGGIGKSTMAKKVIQRLSLLTPGLKVFLFNEEGKEFSLTGMLDLLEEFCFTHDLRDILSAEFYKKQPTTKKIQLLMSEMSSKLDCLFLFDNMETFQADRDGPITSDHQALLKVIEHGLTQTRLRLMLTGRYEIVELADRVYIHSLNDVIESDFIVKCYNLGLVHLNMEQLRFLYTTLGGNFRAVEFFFEAFSKKPEQMQQTFVDLKAFKDSSEDATKSALQRMAENLFFTALFDDLTKEQQQVASMAACYTLPVLDTAFSVHDPSLDARQALTTLTRRTLIQAYLDQETGLVYYFMPPLVQELGQRNTLFADMDQSFHQRAGRYHEYMLSSVCRDSIKELDAAFHHYEKAGVLEKMDALGQGLSAFYYARALYGESRRIAEAMVQAASPNPPFWCLNHMVMIGLSTGTYGEAEQYAQAALKRFQDRKSLSRDEENNLGTTLNNVGQIYNALGKYDTALRYLKQSLKIRRDIGDENGEGMTLNNIAGIANALGKYDTALRYFKQSLKICRKIGDKNGESQSLNNIGQIYDARGEYDTALHYLEQSLKIAKEILDTAGEGTTLNNIGQIYDARGEYDTALHYLEQSLKIAKEILDIASEGRSLNNIAGIAYARGQYNTALGFFEQSLKIQEEIGDIAGEGTTLNNIGLIFRVQGEYDTAFGFFEQSLKIQKEIGDIAGEAVTTFNMALILETKGDLGKALGLAQRTVLIDAKTGHPDLQSDAAYLMHLMEEAYKRGLDIQKLVDPQVLALLNAMRADMGR